MARRKPTVKSAGGKRESQCAAVEGILEKRLEEIVNFLGTGEGAKSYLYEEILSMMERSLIKIALKRCNNIKMNAAAFLGINRNTLHKKMDELGISIREDEKSS